MSKKPVLAVMGGGSGAFCHAADLTLKGYTVSLCAVPEKAESISGVRERGGIELKVLGHAGVEPGFARISKVTTSAPEALEHADIVLVVVPAFAQRRYAEFCARHLRRRQLVVLSPGNFGGCLEFWIVLKEMGVTASPLLAETECMAYAVVKTGAASIEVAGFKHGHTIASFPGRRIPEVIEKFSTVFPTTRPANNILETGLSNINTVVHPPMVLLNAGWVEHTNGQFRLIRHGVTESVGRVIEDVEQERLAVGRACGLNLEPMRDVLQRWYGHCGAAGDTLSQVMRTNPVWERDNAPPSLHHRYLTEDVPYGMVPLESMGRHAAASTPVTTALIALTSSILRKDMRKSGRDLDSLGLQNMPLHDITGFLVDGPRGT